MATSGEVIATITVAEAIDEAFERAGVSKEAIVGAHIRSACRSIDLILMTWAATPASKLWTQKRFTITTSPGVPTYDLPDGVYAPLTVSDGVIFIDPMSNSEYENLGATAATKASTVSQYLARFQYNKCSVTLYPVPDKALTLTVVGISSPSRAKGLSYDLDVPAVWMEAFISELAWRLAVKYSPDRANPRKADAVAAYKQANGGDRDRSDTTFSMGRRR